MVFFLFVCAVCFLSDCLTVNILIRTRSASSSGESGGWLSSRWHTVKWFMFAEAMFFFVFFFLVCLCDPRFHKSTSVSCVKKINKNASVFQSREHLLQFFLHKTCAIWSRVPIGVILLAFTQIIFQIKQQQWVSLTTQLSIQYYYHYQ